MLFQSIFARLRRLTNVNKLVGGLTREFWVGHLLVMISTVLGVYLAAHSGLKTAVEFDAISSDRDNYYLRANLRDEIKYNISIAEKFIVTIDKFGSFHRSNYPAFQTYVMDTMKEQSNTLKTPNVILNGMLMYYDRVDRLLKEKKGGGINVRVLAKKLRKLIDDFNANVMTKLDQNLIDLKARLDENGVVIYE